VASQTHRHQKLSYGLSQLEKYGLKHDQECLGALSALM
jgi:hypothetical protein